MSSIIGISKNLRNERLAIKISSRTTGSILLTASLALLAYQLKLGFLAPLLFLTLSLCHLTLFFGIFVSNVRFYSIPILLPILALVSTVWSVEPNVTLRASVQLLLTVLSAFAFFGSVNLRAFIRCILVAEMIVAAGSIINPSYSIIGTTGELAFIGISASKNIMAMHFCLLFLSSVATILDQESNKAWRTISLAGIILGCILILIAKSVGAVLTCSLAVFVLMFTYFSRRLSISLRRICYLFLLFTLVYLFILIDLYDLRFDVFLNDLGKDATLTGRTTLWTLAIEYIEKNFWLGVGYYGFWVQGHGEAEYIWELLHIDGRGGFHFHNIYLHFAVDIGVIGAVIVAIQFTLALFYSIKLAISLPNSHTAFLLSVNFFFFMRSFVEVDFGYPFSFSTVLITSTFLYTLKLAKQSASQKSHTPAQSRLSSTKHVRI